MWKLSNYKVLSVLGSGSSGTCFKVRHKESGETFAWKAIDYDDWTESILAEIELLRQLEHPNIVRHLDYVVNKEIQTVYIVMEFCEGGDLAQLIEQCKSRDAYLSEDFIWRALYQSCRALQTCHSKFVQGSLLHRDIKPANMFLDGLGNLKLGDFGLAKILSRDQPFAESFVGTPFYMSPEIIKGKKYNRTSDVWALGCLVYEMCALNPPFRGSHMQQLSENITEGNFKRIPDDYSNDLNDFISFLLKVNNDYRPNIDVVLRHPILAAHVPKGEVLFPPFLYRTKPNLKFSPNSNLSSTGHNMDLSTVSTPTLRSELFASTHRRLFTSSSPDLTNLTVKPEPAMENLTEPSVVAENIFNHALAVRLHAIRARESVLQQKEVELQVKEKELNERSKRLLVKEKSAEAAVRRNSSRRRSKKPTKVASYDETESTIAPNDTVVVPTVAKMDLASMQRPKAFTRKITFKSPKKFVQYNIENMEPLKSSASPSLKTSASCCGSKKTHRRMSVFSMFSQKSGKSQEEKVSDVSNPEALQTGEITNKWTSPNKRAAFKILAAMNEAQKQEPDHGRNRRSMILRKP